MERMIFTLVLGGAMFLAGCASQPASASSQPATGAKALANSETAGVPAADLTVTITCSEPGTSFAGTIISDGKTQTYSGKIRGVYRATGHQIECAFKKETGAGTMKMSVAEAGKNLGEAITDESKAGVRAEIVRGASHSHSLFATYK